MLFVATRRYTALNTQNYLFNLASELLIGKVENKNVKRRI